MRLVFTGTRDELRRRLAGLPALLAGKGPQGLAAAQRLHVRLALTLFSLVKRAFLTKARGGTDAFGITWVKLSPKTVAYGRRHPGLAAKRASAAAQGRPGRPLLSAAEDKLWRGLFASAYHRFRREGQGVAEAKAGAAGIAWAVLKSRGAKTILGTYGNAQVEILRDTGRLLNSLSPGVPGGNPDQVFRAEPGKLTLGTNAPGWQNHAGRGKVPARPFWGEELPEEWARELEAEAEAETATIIESLVR